MAVVTCRCGQSLDLPPGDAEHVTCPRCNAKVRLIRKRRGEGASASGSGIAPGEEFVRFHCPCGRRLKVSALDRPTHGKCPDCGRIVPVPTDIGTSRADSPTEELGKADLAVLEAWTKSHLSRENGNVNGNGKGAGDRPTSTAEMVSGDFGRRAEAGFRVCPKCSKPIHLNADICRGCGTPVPKR